METRARKRARLTHSLAYTRWRIFHEVKHHDDYDFRVFPGFETVWMAMCDPEQTDPDSYVQIAQLSLPGSLRLPQHQ